MQGPLCGLLSLTILWHLFSKGIGVINIRRAELTDLEAMTEIYNEAILTSTATFDLAPQTREQRLNWFESHEERFPILVAECDGEVAGWACLSRWRPRKAYERTAETSFYVKGTQRGKGIGRQLKQAIIDEARRLNFHTLIAGVAQGNEVSLHLNQSFGFEVVGTFREVGNKFDQWLDVTYLQLMLN
ncbi:N-acyltransferase YncA [Gimesia panareensis]|uniref:N-acyltransferase YncA n=1 Tax=Gimesia panareensis TaxID=2527978 RepID=A0A517Q3F5_9PLAN|nr:GNAT family N-acetyltransferase [Gimesia panareensis]QDT26158.1 N-acyltransferase YncA [Gimesia panareensis]